MRYNEWWHWTLPTLGLLSAVDPLHFLCESGGRAAHQTDSFFFGILVHDVSKCALETASPAGRSLTEKKKRKKERKKRKTVPIRLCCEKAADTDGGWRVSDGSRVTDGGWSLWKSALKGGP